MTQERQTALKNRCAVAVRPDWTDDRGILGYFNPLTKRYIVQPTLELLLRARQEMSTAERESRSPHPFFVILDEMNLAHVEQYFSDFLSCLESNEPLDLHQEPEIESGANEDEVAVPQKLEIPRNVFFTGTVNVDETTYMFSPKVLDRAFTIELHSVDLKGFGKPADYSKDPVGALRLRSLPTLHAPRTPGLGDWNGFGKLEDAALQGVIIALNELLAPFTLHFGYRVANEIARFVVLAAHHTDGTSQSLWAALDLAILEKILPKFHGTQEELDEPLRALFSFAGAGAAVSLAPWDEIRDKWRLRSDRLERIDGELADVRLPRTATKIWLMLRRLHQQGFTAFIS